ncbi:MAG: transglycosylase domain-containing protein, partial [Candidatus Methylomirabilota bacterium]
MVGLFAAGAVGLVGVWWSSPLLDLRKEHLPAVRLYAGSAEIATLRGTARHSQIWIPLGEIPQPVVDAVLVAEDRRFFHHPGIDVRAVLRAAVTNLRRGGVRQGGSTITQQLARMLFFSNERTWVRKLRESGAALLLETQYSKRQILEVYLNAVYMGHDGDVAIHGIGAASRHFLGKDLAEVRLDEAALLAAAIQAPNRTFLGHFPRAVQARRNRILQAMRDLGTAGETAVREAAVTPLPRPPAGSAAQEAYFVDLVREEIARRVSLPASGEVRIATTLDPLLQHAAERALREGLERIERAQPGLERVRLQAALVAIQPASGAIRALVGGRRYRESSFNRATQAARQPGSLFKPIVYLAAFEAERAGRGARLTPASLVLDDPIAIPVGSSTWLPQNFDRRFRGPVTVRAALVASLNVPAVRVAQDVGVHEVVQMAQALGIARPLAAVPSLALGTSEVTLLEITAAYATLANGGVRAVPTTLAAESAPQGALAVEPIPPPVRVVSAESVFLINHLLRGVMRHGTGRASARWGLSGISAGKTGTTGGLRDAWFVGYTPDLVVGVWVGLDDDSPVGLTGAQAALPIWAAVMQAAVRQSPP